MPEPTVKPERDGVYNTENFPTFICNHGNWDIYTNSRGRCAAIPTRDAAAIGCKATQFGDRAYVKNTLPAEYAAWEALQRKLPNSDVKVHGDGNHGQASNIEQFIKIAADSIDQLRKVDVFRVLGSIREDNIDGVTRRDLATFIAGKRLDLVDEVTEVMSEEFPQDGWEPVPAGQTLEQAKALGFESVAAMREHQAWLEKNGTPEYKSWAASVAPAQKQSRRRIEAKPADLQSGDVLPYHLNEEVKRVERIDNRNVCVYFVGGRERNFDSSVILTAVRAVA
jgi:hypothetical protein